MRNFIPEEILIEKKERKSKLAGEVIKKFPDSKIFYIDDFKDCLNSKNSVSIDQARKKLIIARKKSGFIKPCPGTPGYLCCNYYILDVGLGCFYDCSYCYLQAYMNFPGIVFYANLNDFFHEVDLHLKTNPSLFFRLGTGEFTDSLALEDVFSYAGELIPFFSDKKILLELKTKGDNVKNLLELNHGKRTVLAWSVNPPVIVREEEKDSASLDRRLKGASLCVKAGYPVAFHFDPIIIYPGWENDYQKVIKRIFECVSENNIYWISLGTLRFPPELKNIIAERFPKTQIIYEEFITGLDGKWRYFKPKRVEIYRKMLSWIREMSADVPLYLCMESRDVWKKVFGFYPKGPREVERLFLRGR